MLSLILVRNSAYRSQLREEIVKPGLNRLSSLRKQKESANAVMDFVDFPTA